MTDLKGSGSGLAPNVAGALSYVLGPITGILFLVIEKENRFVRFHAAQSIMVSIALIVISVGLTIFEALLSAVPVVGLIIGLLLSLVFAFASFALWLLLMFRAFQGHEWEVPVVGKQARKILPASPA